MKKISIIIPAYNEEETISLLYDKLSKIINEMENYEFELIFINDGSNDNTLNIIKPRILVWITCVTYPKNKTQLNHYYFSIL